MTQSSLRNTIVSSKDIFLICATAPLLLAALYVFMVYYAYPAVENVMSIYVPARSGGKEYFVSLDEFTLIGAIALAVSVVLTVVVGVLLRLKKTMIAMTVTLITVALSSIFAATYLGNAFDELWGGWWSVVGAGGVLLAMLAVELPLLSSMGNRKNADRLNK